MSLRIHQHINTFSKASTARSKVFIVIGQKYDRLKPLRELVLWILTTHMHVSRSTEKSNNSTRYASQTVRCPSLKPTVRSSEHKKIKLNKKYFTNSCHLNVGEWKLLLVFQPVINSLLANSVLNTEECPISRLAARVLKETVWIGRRHERSTSMNLRTPSALWSI